MCPAFEQMLEWYRDHFPHHATRTSLEIYLQWAEHVQWCGDPIEIQKIKIFSPTFSVCEINACLPRVSL